MNNKVIKLVLVDVLMCGIALYGSFLLRFEFVIPKEFFSIYLHWLPWFVFIQALVFYFTRLYARIWRYTSLFDLFAIISAVFSSCVLSTLFVFFTMGSEGYPRSVLILYCILNNIFTASARLCVRVYYSHYHKDSIFKNNNQKRNQKALLLIGAGRTGEKIAREILSTARDKYKIIGFVDDDSEKHGGLLHSKKIFCGISELLNLNIKYDAPFIFCVSTDLNISQSLERSGGKFGNKGTDSALAALQLIK